MPGAGCAADDGRLPARFAIEDVFIPTGIPAVVAVTDLPVGANFFLFVAGGFQVESKGQELSIIGLELIFQLIGLQFMLGEGEL